MKNIDMLKSMIETVCSETNEKRDERLTTNIDKLKLCGYNARVIPEVSKRDCLNNEVVIDIRSNSLNNLMINLSSVNQDADIHRLIESFIEEHK